MPEFQINQVVRINDSTGTLEGAVSRITPKPNGRPTLITVKVTAAGRTRTFVRDERDVTPVYRVPTLAQQFASQYRENRRIYGPAESIIRIRNMFANSYMHATGANGLVGSAVENLREIWALADDYAMSCHSRPGYWWKDRPASDWARDRNLKAAGYEV